MAAPAAMAPRGYHRLADLMGRYSETAIFRRFSSLNMLNLLSLQAELIDLQVQFRDIWAEDEESTDVDEKEFSTYFRKLRKLENSLQYEMLVDIRKKLDQYNAALLQVAQLSRVSSPEDADVEFLRSWLQAEGEGENFLHGSEQYTWTLPRHSTAAEHKFFSKDFVTVHSGVEEQDVFSKLLSSSLLDVWTWLRSCGGYVSDGERPFRRQVDPDSGLLHYSEASLLRINNILISVIGATLPVVAIVALYLIKSQGGRIGAMAGFTVVFALVLAIFTNARRLEIAASTAAFAAVEVVFIGSDLGKS